MKQHQGVWLPDHEEHLIGWMNGSGELVDGVGTYQIRKLRAALEHVKSWRMAVDVGAHVGFWSMHLAKRFKSLQAFEPIDEHRQCWLRNMAPLRSAGNNAILWSCALGAEKGTARFTIPPGSSGGTHISGHGGVDDIEVRTLDSFEFADVDFMKLDCEGAELAVLQGAAETLKRCRPCVIVEQKQHIMQRNFGVTGKPAVDFLESLGAVQRAEISGDYILTWP